MRVPARGGSGGRSRASAARALLAAMSVAACSCSSVAARPTMVAAARSTSACNISLGLAAGGGSCAGYSFCGQGADATFTMSDSYTEPYLIAPPFAKAVGPGGKCAACAPAQAGANGYQFMTGGAVCAARCIPLAFPTAFLSARPLSAADPMGGVVVSFGGGTGGRKLIHEVKCKAGAPLRPIGLVATRDPAAGSYTVHWEGNAGCGKPALCAPLARPTAAQLRWQELEIGALIHFNMATYAPGGTFPGAQCSPDPDTFNPAQLDTDQWARAFTSFGCREAVLVVKHNCGFVTWPVQSKIRVPLFAECTLNATGPSRVTLSLRQ